MNIRCKNIEPIHQLLSRNTVTVKNRVNSSSGGITVDSNVELEPDVRIITRKMASSLIDGIYNTPGVWYKAVALREEGLTWSQVAVQLIYAYEK